MQNHGTTVKSGVFWGCATLVIWMFAGCATAPRPVSPSKGSHPNYLAQNLDVARFDLLRSQVETVAKETLKSRGEAHVTVITPPEFDVLKSKVTMAEIEAIAARLGLSDSAPEEICIGRGDKLQNAKELRAYFVVVRAPVALEVRREVEKLYRSRGGGTGFSANRFYPHVTLGFTDRDLHEQDGIIKDRRSCDKRFKL